MLSRNSDAFGLLPMTTDTVVLVCVSVCVIVSFQILSRSEQKDSFSFCSIVNVQYDRRSRLFE